MAYKRIRAADLVSAYRRYGACYCENLEVAYSQPFTLAHPLIIFLVFKKRLAGNWRQRIRSQAIGYSTNTDDRLANYAISELIKMGYTEEYLQGFLNAISRTGIISSCVDHLLGFDDGVAARAACRDI
jgi:hypothetical protein